MFNKTPASSDADHQASDQQPDTLGCYLKGTRLSQGLELTEIAAATRVDIKNLTALEHDDRGALPADVFTRGFVRIYASHLKLDPEEAIRRYEQQWGSDLTVVVSPLEQIKSPPSFWPGVIIALTLIIIFFGARFFSSDPPIDTGSIPVPGTSTIATDPTLTPDPSTKISAETPLLQEKTPPADAPQEQMPVGTESPPYEIVLTCEAEVPLTINLDNVRTTKSVCPPKSPQTWRADKGFDLTLTITRGVTLSINGVPVPIMEAEEGKSITIRRP